jgi:hypothetical protein
MRPREPHSIICAAVPRNTAIVECWLWKGKSTIYLGQGLLDRPQSVVYAIDPHVGSLSTR